MTAWSFASGLVVVVAIVGSTACGARRARRRWFGAEGASALLVEATAVLAQLYTVGFILGAVGWFHRWPYAAGCVVVGAGLAAAAAPGRGPDLVAAKGAAEKPPPRLEPMPMGGNLLAGLAVVAVSGQYLAHSLVSIGSGMYDTDTMWYHGPLAAHFVQDGWLTRLYFEGGERLVTYYPDNGEVAAAVAILPFHRDGLLPLLNLGWLALALLAGWCIGRRYRRGPVGVAAVAVAATLPMMASRQAGTLGNDLTGMALLLVSVALLLEGGWQPPWLVLSGAAAGLAAGVKLSLLPPVAVLVLAVLGAAPAGRRLRSISVWGAALVLSGFYWPARNWARAGNPFPWVSLHLGPLRLAAVPLPGSTLHDTDVLHYVWRAGSWGGIFAPGLRVAFGPAWPVVLLVAGLGGLSVVAAGRDRTGRLVALVGLAGVVLYAAIPNTVFPPPLARYTFADTSRYAVPALALTLVVLSRSRLVARPWAALAATAAMTAVVVASQFPRVLQGYGTTPEWPLPAQDVVVGLLVAAAVAGAAAVWRKVRWGPARLGVPAVAGLALLWPLQAAVTGQYGAASTAGAAGSVFSWGRHVSHARIAVAEGWGKYPLYGPDLDNRVQYVSAPGPHGTFSDPTTCAAWRRALNAGHYDYLVLFPAPAFTALGPSRAEQHWVDGDPHAVLAGRYRDAQVWRLLGPLDPSRCGPAAPLPPA